MRLSESQSFAISTSLELLGAKVDDLQVICEFGLIKEATVACVLSICLEQLFSVFRICQNHVEGLRHRCLAYTHTVSNFPSLEWA